MPSISSLSLGFNQNEMAEKDKAFERAKLAAAKELTGRPLVAHSRIEIPSDDEFEMDLKRIQMERRKKELSNEKKEEDEPMKEHVEPKTEQFDAEKGSTNEANTDKKQGS